MIKINRFPEGRKKALLMSFDDGRDFDRQLADLMRQHNLRGTFHLNAGTLDEPGFITSTEIQETYAGHEVSAHGYSHPYLSQLSKTARMAEMVEDRRILEQLSGTLVRGMSYPFGDYSPDVIAALPEYGIEYARTVNATGQFLPPIDFLAWHPTCHHQDRMKERLEAFKAAPHWVFPPVLNIWGHSYEIESTINLANMKDLLAELGEMPDLWSATYVEMMDYLKALRGLIFSSDMTHGLNPSNTTVWVEVDGEAFKIAPGAFTI